MRDKPKNVIIGTVFVDIKGFPDTVYIEKGRNAGSIEYVHGGVGRNIAENLGRQGCRPTFLSVIDHSSLSEDIIKRLQESDVETKYLARSEGGLGTWLAIFDHEGDVVASISKQPAMQGLLPLMEKQEAEIFSDAAGVSVELGMGPGAGSDVLPDIMHYAGAYDLPVFAVIANMKLAMDEHAFDYPITCLVCNQQEAEMMLSDLSKDSIREYGLADSMIRKIRDQISAYPIEKMVVTLGEDGAVYYDTKDGSFGWVSAMPVQVCDTTGAGDAFFSGVVIGLTRGDSLEEACRIGTKLASSVISTKENVTPEGLV